jgi:hypothetical protein
MPARGEVWVTISANTKGSGGPNREIGCGHTLNTTLASVQVYNSNT